MKNKFLAVLLVLVLALGAWCAVQWRQLQAARAQLAATEQAVQAETETRTVLTEKVKALEAQRARLGQDVDQFTSLVNTLRAKESAHASNFARLASPPASDAPTTADAGKGGDGAKGLGGMLGKMMQDPAIKEMIRSQQKMVMQKMYGPLLKDLNLPSEQKDRFMELLLSQQMSAVENAGALFKEGDTDKTEAAKAMKDKQTELESNLKTLLGDDKFAQYQDYTKTMAERMQLDQFRQQLDSGSLPLQEDQAKSLMQAMKEEREKVPPVVPSKVGDSPADYAKALSPENLDKQVQWQEDVNRRVQERAAQILTPEQLKEFTDFQNQQLNMQKVGMKMAREMFGGDKAAPPTAVEVIAPPK